MAFRRSDTRPDRIHKYVNSSPQAPRCEGQKAAIGQPSADCRRIAQPPCLIFYASPICRQDRRPLMHCPGIQNFVHLA
jgi:hypothetical protein